MFAPEIFSEKRDKVWLFDENGDFRVPVAIHTAVVDVGRANDSLAVVNDQEFRVDVDLLSDQKITEFLVLLKTKEPDVIRGRETCWDIVLIDEEIEF